mgnify:FL=1
MQHGLLHRKLVQVRIKKRWQAHRERHGEAEGPMATWSVEVVREASRYRGGRNAWKYVRLSSSWELVNDSGSVPTRRAEVNHMCVPGDPPYIQ